MCKQNIGNDPRHSVQAGAEGASHSTGAADRERILCGYLLPTTEQLLRGMPFMGGDMGRDMRTFAETLLREAEAKDPAGVHQEIRSACRAILSDESLEAVQAAAEALRSAELKLIDWSPDAQSGKLRCWLYSVHLGDMHSIIPVAITATTMAYQGEWNGQDDLSDLLWRALAWMTLYAGDIPELFREDPPFAGLATVADRVATIAEDYRSRVAASTSRDFTGTGASVGWRDASTSPALHAADGS